MPTVSAVREHLQAGGLSLLAVRGIEKALLESSITIPAAWGSYWLIAPRYYRRLNFEIDRYRSPPDPYKILWVDPDRITRFSGRRYPPWEDARYQFGRVQRGEWDIRTEPPVADDYHGTPPELYLAETFESTPLYRSLAAHFEDGVPWHETEFVRRAKAALEQGGSVWNGCETTAEIDRRCQELDALYDSIAATGCQSYRQFLRDRDALELNFLECLRQEICVDIGREGELLFVDGRHRLSIAKLLDLDRVPVVVAVRHAEWMARRAGWAADSVPPHPDLRAL